MKNNNRNDKKDLLGPGFEPTLALEQQFLAVFKLKCSSIGRAEVQTKDLKLKNTSVSLCHLNNSYTNRPH